MLISTEMLSNCWLLSSVSGFFFDENRTTFFWSLGLPVAAEPVLGAGVVVVVVDGNSVMGNLEVSLMPNWRDLCAARSRIFWKWNLGDQFTIFH